MPADLDLALRVRADMRDALRGIGALNRGLGDTARRGDAAGSALDGAAGAARALGTLGRETGSALDGLRDATAGAFRSMEDALADFVTTGKFSVRSFVDSVVADLARIAVRQAITAPLANAFLGALGGGGAAGAVSAGVGHEGLVAGRPGGVRRAVPPAVFAGAPRYHAGGIAGLRADEVPIIAQRGETILPRGAAIAPPSVEINFRNQGTPQREVSREARLDPRGVIVTVVTDDLDRGGPISQRLRRGAGGAAL